MIDPSETPDASPDARALAPPPEEPPAAAPAEALDASTAALIEAWFVEHMHSSIVSRSTDIYNHVRAAVDDLKTRLGKEIGK